MRRTLSVLANRATLAATVVAVLLGAAARLAPGDQRGDRESVFPGELVNWAPAPGNPLFSGQGDGHWDKQIRERGWILHEQGEYRLWYTGYDGTREGIKQLGYATSPDGLRWTRSKKNPLCRDRWIEDMMVVNSGGLYYMFAEGPKDGHAELLTSEDGVDWTWQGPLRVREADGMHDAEGPCGTPTAWVEDGVWRLFYERHDLGVWLATSSDPLSRVWTNVLDDPVLVPGPGDYDKRMIALDQVIQRDGVYFAFYHGCGDGTPRTWNTCVARSTDLTHWEKFAGNPVVENKSSGIVVTVGSKRRLYTMHGQIELFNPRAD